MSAECCTKVLNETVEKYCAPSIFNTDQVSQYISEIDTKTLKDDNVKYQ